MKKNIFFLFTAACFGVVAFSCSMQKQIGKEAQQAILANTDFAPAHVGISLYDPATGQCLYNYQGDKSFVPASNMKLFTCYAAMKNLGDSLVGLRYVDKGDGVIEAQGSGDPCFLHPDFKNQPVFDLLKKKRSILLTDENWKDNGWGAGWAWDDYNSDYMAQRSMMPIYGNLVRFKQTRIFTAEPAYFQKQLEEAVAGAKGSFTIKRQFGSNIFTVTASENKFSATDIPLYTEGNEILIALMNDTLKTKVEQIHGTINGPGAIVKIYSQPTDSLLKIMMHRSDNFFAEQTLLMISNEKLGLMNDAKIIDTLLKTDFRDLPQKPKWVDGSGLSRYNLVSPRDFVWVLTQMKSEFKWERIKEILPTGGEGTLSSYYKNYAGRIYAKTGSLSNHIALSGYITTKKGKQWIFSVLVNGHLTAAANIRKGIEKFLTVIMDRY